MPRHTSQEDNECEQLLEHLKSFLPGIKDAALFAFSPEQYQSPSQQGLCKSPVNILKDGLSFPHAQ